MTWLYGLLFDLWRGLWFYLADFAESVDDALADTFGEEDE